GTGFCTRDAAPWSPGVRRQRRRAGDEREPLAPQPVGARRLEGVFRGPFKLPLGLRSDSRKLMLSSACETEIDWWRERGGIRAGNSQVLGLVCLMSERSVQNAHGL